MLCGSHFLGAGFFYGDALGVCCAAAVPGVVAYSAFWTFFSTKMPFSMKAAGVS